MTTEQKLQRIRAKCVALLALAEKRTPGKWNPTIYEHGGARCAREVGGKRDLIFDSYNEGDAIFIASCAGAAEAGWRSTIAAIDFVTAFTEPDKFEMTSAIIAAWPEELL